MDFEGQRLRLSSESVNCAWCSRMAGGRLFKLRFCIGCEMNFHVLFG
jgi:hypothetical protein